MIRPVSARKADQWFPRVVPCRDGFGDQIFNNEIIAGIPLYFNTLDAPRRKKVSRALIIVRPDRTGTKGGKQRRPSPKRKAISEKQASPAVYGRRNAL